MRSKCLEKSGSMNFMTRLERKYGKYAIPNLSLYIIICYVIGYVISLFNSKIFMMLVLSPYHVCHGQVWRLVTWVLRPPSSFSIFTIIMLMFYYSIGNSLERTMGTFRYNVFIFGGVLMTAIGVMAAYGVGVLVGGTDSVYLTNLTWSLASATSTYYLCTSIFLAFALFYPNMQVLLYFVIPVKVRWIAILDLVLMGYDFFKGDLGTKVVIGIALLNLLLFFLTTRKMRYITPGEIKRRRTYAREVKNATPITRHKCAVCGRTEKDGDDLVFRFCTKCNGNYEYCQDHMFTHEHVK